MYINKFILIIMCLIIISQCDGMEEQPYTKLPVVVQSVQTSMEFGKSLQEDSEQKLLSGLPSAQDTSLDIELQEEEYNIKYPENTNNVLIQTKLTATDAVDNFWKRHLGIKDVSCSIVSFGLGFLSGAIAILGPELIYIRYYA